MGPPSSGWLPGLRPTLHREHTDQLVAMLEENDEQVAFELTFHADLVRIEGLSQVAACVADRDTWVPDFKCRDKSGYLSSAEILVVVARGQWCPCRDVVNGWPFHFCFASARITYVGQVEACSRDCPLYP